MLENIETRIHLNKFQPRPYQIPVINALESGKFKRLLCIWPRRAGKDLVAFWLCIRACLRKVQTIYYIFPTYSSGRKFLWDAITSEGLRVLDLCPPELIESRNEQQMRIRFINGSVLQVIGSTDYDTSIIGTNPQGIVFSEYALQDPRAYQYSRPILTANQGWALFLSTPRGKNHLYTLYQVASTSPNEWFCSRLTVNDTEHINMQEIKREVELGELSEDMVQQEYFCSFEMGQDGYFYSSILDKMRLKGQIGIVAWEPMYKVHTAWDLGINDPTVIIFYQTIGNVVNIIDYYSASNRAIDHFVNVVLNKPYTYGKHFPPHDIAVREQGSGLTRREMYKRLGINFSEPYNIDLLDGIEVVKATLAKIWIDETKCKDLLKSLYAYRQEWDSNRKQYKGIPLHDDASHGSDALRYLCLSLPKSKDGLSAEELDKRYREAVYGTTNTGFFREDI